MSLCSRVIRLASADVELRPLLLPLLKEAKGRKRYLGEPSMSWGDRYMHLHHWGDEFDAILDEYWGRNLKKKTRRGDLSWWVEAVGAFGNTFHWSIRGDGDTGHMTMDVMLPDVQGSLRKKFGPQSDLGDLVEGMDLLSMDLAKKAGRGR